MRISKILTVFLGTLLFLVISNGALAVELRNEESVCLSQRRCDQTNPNACSDENDYPLVRVHRVLLELIANMSSTDIFIHECVQVQGAQICLPLPIERNAADTAWVLKNFKADGESVVWAANTAHQQFYKDALEQKCIARYMDPTEGETLCHEFYYGSGTIGQPGYVEGYFEGPEWDQVNALLTNSNYQFHGIYQGVANVSDRLTPITAYPVTGTLGSRFEWGSSTSLSLTRSFRVTAFSNPITGTTGNDTSDKVGQLGFLSTAATCQNAPNYDPFGQVFDTESLQPIEDAKVALYKLNLTPTPGALTDEYILVTRANTPTILDETFRNPQLSGAFGEFSFLMPPGQYKLLVDRRNSTPPDSLPVLPVATNVMNGNATQLGDQILVTVDGAIKALYPKVYQVSTVGTDLDIPVIIEQTAAERRDIAMLTLTPAPARALTYFRTVNAAGDNYITGQINKPFGLVIAETPTGTLLAETRADINGSFSLIVDASLLPVNRPYHIRAAATQLPQVTPTPTMSVSGITAWIHKVLGYLIPEVHAQSTDEIAVIKPRLNHVEGYAYDATGNILKNAEVIIFDMVSGSPSYSTKTDTEGYFSIMSENLPLNDYKIYYLPEGSTKMISTDAEQFINQNKAYIETNKVNLVQPKYGKPAEVYLTKNPLPTVANSQGSAMNPKPGTSGSPNDAVAPTRAVEPGPVSQPVSSALLMYVAILLLLIVGAGLLIMYYMKRKQEPHLYE